MKAEQDKTYEKVIEYIEDGIRQGKLKKGDRLPPERDLAQMLGVARNTVREALRTMSNMGFISSIQGGGNYIDCDPKASIGRSMAIMLMMGEINYRQINQLRRALETECVINACGGFSEAQLKKLKNLAEKIESEQDHGKAAQFDISFHRLIMDVGAGNLVKSVYEGAGNIIDISIADMFARISRNENEAKALHKAHHDIVSALEYKDKNRLEEAVKRHYDIVERNI